MRKRLISVCVVIFVSCVVAMYSWAYYTQKPKGSSSASVGDTVEESVSSVAEESIESMLITVNGRTLTDEVYRIEKEIDWDAEVKSGGHVEIHYPQLIREASAELTQQINIILRDTAFSFFYHDYYGEITYEEAIDLIKEEIENGVFGFEIEYEVLQYSDSYISLLFSMVVSNSSRVNTNHFLATIDLATGQYVHFEDLMDMEELSGSLRNNLFEVYEGTQAFFKKKDAHEQEIVEEFIGMIEKQMNGHNAANPHYDMYSFQNIGMDEKYIYIRFRESEFYSLHGYFILRIPLNIADFVETAAILNRDIFGELSDEGYFESSELEKEIHAYANEVKGDFEAVPYEGDLFPPELIHMAEEGLYHYDLTSGKMLQLLDRWADETLDYLGANEFRLDLGEMYRLFPELIEYKDEINSEYDAYSRIMKARSVGGGSLSCGGIFRINMTPDDEYYVFVYWDGGNDKVQNVLLTKQVDNEFVEVDEFEIQTGNGRVVQYGNDFYYVYLYRNEYIGCVDGIRIHKLGTDALHENILVKYLPESYAWKNIYDNDDIDFGAELDEYIDSIKVVITSDEYLQNGQEKDPRVYFGDETEDLDSVVEEGKRFYKIDFANIGVPVYMSKGGHFPMYNWSIWTRFYLHDGKHDMVLELENLGSYWTNRNMVQIWFKEIDGKVLTFRVYYISDYNYVLNVMLVEGDQITQIRNDVFSPDKSRFILTEGELFTTMG